MSNKVSVTCENPQCGTVYQRSKSSYNEALKKGSVQTCSSECRKVMRTTSVTKPCINCGGPVTVTQSVLKNSKSGKFFCSHSCSAKYSNKRRVVTEEQKAKVSKTLKKVAKVRESRTTLGGYRTCLVCTREFYARSSTSLFCTRDCHHLAQTGIGLLSDGALLTYLQDFQESHGALTSKLVPRAIHNQSKKAFGSWNKAVVAAGIAPHSGNTRKSRLTCKDGHISDSAEECLVDNWLYSKGILHEIDKYYPGTYLTCDFYLPEYDVWVEYLGLYEEDAGYRERFELKKEIARREGFTLVGILRDDIRVGSTDYQIKIAEHLKDKKYPRTYDGPPGPPMVELNCSHCGRTFERRRRQARRTKEGGNQYCGRECLWESMKTVS